MSGDPKECRLNAMRCAELANSAKTPELKQTLLDISQMWVKLAIEMEQSYALIDRHTPSTEGPG